MAEETKEKRMGWESARELEAAATTMGERAKLSKGTVKRLALYLLVFGLLFILACWLAGNPFDATQRIPSDYVKAKGWAGTGNWSIVWYVVAMCAFFEFMDSAGGMGYGTALTPLMLVLGFDPKQVVPCVMITEAVTGIIAGLVHGEFANVEWKFKPINETTKLVMIVCAVGIVCVCFSITAVYAALKVHKVWIKLYVAMLLVVMGVCSLITAKKAFGYRPKLMLLFAGVGGFNKGIGGGGYGPVITVGGLLSGIPVKSMVAITSFAEGVTCVFAVCCWLVLLKAGIVIDYLLLPSFVIGTIIASVGAPYVTRVFPEKAWKIIVPVYCCFLAILCFYKIMPGVIEKLRG